MSELLSPGEVLRRETEHFNRTLEAWLQQEVGPELMDQESRNEAYFSVLCDLWERPGLTVEQMLEVREAINAIEYPGGAILDAKTRYWDVFEEAFGPISSYEIFAIEPGLMDLRKDLAPGDNTKNEEYRLSVSAEAAPEVTVTKHHSWFHFSRTPNHGKEVLEAAAEDHEIAFAAIRRLAEVNATFRMP